MPARLKEGDWICADCGNHNFASRENCNKCGAVKPEGSELTAADIPAAGGSGQQMKEGDWICEQCSNHNYASRVVCNKCGAPKPGADMAAFAPAPMRTATPTIARGGMKEGDWICNECGNHNFASRVNCNRCGAPKPFGSARPMFQPSGAGRSTPYSPHVSMGVVSAMPFQASGAPPSGMKEGDWMCQSCGNHNFASRVQCNKCGAVREGMRAGDWICKSCRAHNFASKVQCHKCGAPKPPDGGHVGRSAPMMMSQLPVFAAPQMSRPTYGAVAGKGGKGMGFAPQPVMMPMHLGRPANMKEGDWLCAQCGNHNYASRTECNKCGALRPGMKRGDWICPACKNHNFASRTECNKCGAPKPEPRGVAAPAI